MAQDVTSLIVRIESLEADVARIRLKKLGDAGKDTEKSFDMLRKAAGALGAAIAGIGFSAMISSAARAGREIDTFSKQLNVSTEVMSQWGYASESVGFSTEKMADIFKDVTEKIGDAFLNNAGEAKDALTALGIPLSEIARLSPDQQLLKIGDALNKLGTQGEKVQVMEALANDASRLIPLLDNNAEQLRVMTDEFDKMGGTLTQLEANQLKQTDKALKDIQTTMYLVGQTIAISLSDEIKGFSDFITIYFKPAIDSIVKGFQTAATVIAGAAAVINFAIKQQFDEARFVINLMKTDLENIWSTKKVSPIVELAPPEDKLIEDAELMKKYLDQVTFNVRENERQIADVKKQYRDKEIDKMVRHHQMALRTSSGFFSALAGIESGASKSSFERQKKFLYAETILSTIASAQAAYYSTLKYGGNVFAASAAAAVAGFQGAGRLAQISRTSFNSSASPAASGSSYSPLNQQQPSAQGQQITIVNDIYIDGEKIYSANGFIKAMNSDKINLETENGRERVVPVYG